MFIARHFGFLVLLFSCSIFSHVAATEQYGFQDTQAVITDRQPYYCQEPQPYRTLPHWPTCCDYNAKCSCLCPGQCLAELVVVPGLQVLGTIDIIKVEQRIPVAALADVTSQRNYIDALLVKELELSRQIRPLDKADVHSIEVDNHNVTITDFVRLDIGIGAGELRILTGRIFEIIPQVVDEDDDQCRRGLVLGVHLLEGAGALLINPAIFIKNNQDGNEIDDSGKSEL